MAWVDAAKSPKQLGEKMTECADWTIEWGRAAGVIFEEEKTELLIFGGKRNIKKKELGQAYVRVGHTKLPLQTKPIRWLGFMLDSKLKFDEHHRVWSGKARKRQSQIKRLCVNNGLPAFSAANLQKAVVQSVATYGIEVFAVLDKDEMPLWQLKDLQTILNEQARRATGQFKTTPVGVLMAEGAMKPAKAILERRKLGFSVRQIASPTMNSKTILVLQSKRWIMQSGGGVSGISVSRAWKWRERTQQEEMIDPWAYSHVWTRKGLSYERKASWRRVRSECLQMGPVLSPLEQALGCGWKRMVAWSPELPTP